MKRSLENIASQLGLNLDTLERWIRQGKIPVSKKGSMGIYNTSELNRWAEKQRKTSFCSENGSSSQDSDSKEEGKLIDSNSNDDIVGLLLCAALKNGGIFHGVTGNGKHGIIESAVEHIPDYPGKDSKEILLQLMERERLTSTGIGQGVAIPHPRNPIANGFTEPMIVTCFLENEVDFDAIDDLPVFVLFLMLSPTVEIHLNLLSRLSFCLRDRSFMRFIRQHPDKKSFLSRIREMEEKLDNPSGR
ncbi:putative nitrogen regulatory protein [Desulfamplus magnetovallimortis]|uniref:Putative nitrogen regulatory protein n=1 Tax=Desulfamplus magnetovallimortis TaxID=1246637 RepID=A0A1W1H4I0_9BACT|nr:PTS sugar transporter subunit IIA [Desulfamplus magnetovallimortis]SLM27379.1 putative nitrogen regulatory protein [Desulfamplus magnetovallimortis]